MTPVIFIYLKVKLNILRIMKRNIFGLLIAIFLSAAVSEAYACTSAIITGRLTKDGRPLLWKHRDTGELNNRIEYFKGPKYSFLALVNSPDEGGVAWTGTNSVGFSIMNTASYNLRDDKDGVDDKEMDQEGVLMFEALGECRTIEDFEKFLKKHKKPFGVEGNFGIIDAEGGAAYFEINNTRWEKIDVNDPKIAPQGYLVYTNHSYTGRINEGMGYIRYTAADTRIKNLIARGGDITPQWIFNNLSRCFYHPVLDIDLREKEIGNGWFIDQDFIPRRITSASVVIKGVKRGEDPLNTVMWTVLGYPPTSVAVPLFVKAGENQPSFMTKSDNSKNALLCNMSLKAKSKIFAIKRGNGNKYFNFKALYNRKGDGVMQKMMEAEHKVFSLSNRFIKDHNGKEMGKEELENFYTSLFQEIERAF